MIPFVGAAHRVVVGGPEAFAHRTRQGGAFGTYAVAAMVALDLFSGVGVEASTYVHPSHKAEITLEEAIPPSICLARIEAEFKDANATVHYRVKSKTGFDIFDTVVNGVAGHFDIASWTEKWSGKLGGIICPDYSALTHPVWEPDQLRPNCDPLTGKPYPAVTPGKTAAQQVDNSQPLVKKPLTATSIEPDCKGAYVITLDLAKDMTTYEYEVEPGTGWTSDTGGLAGGSISALTDVFNQIGIGHADIIDNQQNPLRKEVMAMVYSQLTDQCIPQAVKDMSPAPNVTAADAALTQPRTFTGNLVKFVRDQYNQSLKFLYMTDIKQRILSTVKNTKTPGVLTKKQLDEASKTFDTVMANNPKYMVSENDFVVKETASSNIFLNQWRKFKQPFSTLVNSSKQGKNPVTYDPNKARPKCGPVDADAKRTT